MLYVNDPNKANAVTKGYNDRGFDFEKEDYDKLANEWVAEYLSREKSATLIDGVESVLQYFHCNVI